MSEKNETPTGYIKKETMQTVVLIALGVGFLGGATLSSFKFESGDSTPAQATQQQAAQQQAVQEGGITSDVADKISALEMETSLNPKNVEAWTQLGNFYFDTDQVEEAIEAFTLTAAYASFQEDILGSITPRKLADMIVLSQDILTIDPMEIEKTKVLWTIVNGKVIYRRDSP